MMKNHTKEIVITLASISSCYGQFKYRSGSTLRSVSYSDDSIPSSPRLNDEDESPCRYYNSLEQRFSWAARRDRCNAESGCKFLGRRFSGTCVPTIEYPVDIEDTSAAEGAISSSQVVVVMQESKPADSSTSLTANDVANHSKYRHRLYAEIVNDDNDAPSPLRVLVHETLSSSAVDSIRDSQQLANELAKCLIIEVLDRKENRGKLGLLLQHLFVSDAVLSPTRELVYWSLTLDETVKNTIFYTNLHRNYWLGLSKIGQHVRTRRGVERQQGAKELTQEAILALAIQWLSDPQTRKVVINPLLDWTLKSQESVIAPLATITAESIPWAKVSFIYGRQL